MPFPDEVVYKIYDFYDYASEKLRLDNMSHIYNDRANHLWNVMLQTESDYFIANSLKQKDISNEMLQSEEEDYFIADSLEQMDINHKEEDSLSSTQSLAIIVDIIHQ